MHVLTVLDHPNQHSFSAAAAQHFMKGATDAGHTVELADLHAEQFNPLWQMSDIDGDDDDLSDIKREQTRILRADAICLVFPLFWWGMPSMMKGWVDRVWRWGWAYDQLGDLNKSLQCNRTGMLLVPAGVSSDRLEEEGYRDALETLWMKGTFGYFGLNPRRIEFLCGAEGSDLRRQHLLQRCYEIGHQLNKA